VASAAELITQSVNGILAEVPHLANLKIVVGLELRGRGDTQLYRVELPGPKISKGYADDERLHVSIPRSDFNELAAEGKLKHWHEAYDHGHVKVEGDPRVQQLVGGVMAKAEARQQLRKAR
jgi:hypothetical protein